MSETISILISFQNACIGSDQENLLVLMYLLHFDFASPCHAFCRPGLCEYFATSMNRSLDPVKVSACVVWRKGAVRYVDGYKVHQPR